MGQNHGEDKRRGERGGGAEMRGIEPTLMAHMSEEPKTTAQLIEEIFGESAGARDKKAVYIALVCLTKDGAIESHMSYNQAHPSRIWALPGGRFPTDRGRPMTERIMDSLRDGPMRIERIYAEVYRGQEMDQTEYKRLTKALQRLRERGMVRRCPDPETGLMRPSTWRMNDEE